MHWVTIDDHNFKLVDGDAQVAAVIKCAGQWYVRWRGTRFGPVLAGFEAAKGSAEYIVKRELAERPRQSAGQNSCKIICEIF